MQQKPNDNELTLKAYELNTQAYVEGTPPPTTEQKAWLDRSLKLLPANPKIFEIGSGFGRDAEYVREQGYAIECSDAIPSFLTILKEKGFDAHMLNVLTDPVKDSRDMILANAVLLHFTPEESALVLDKIYNALNDHGILALAMKQGDGPVWTEEKLGEPRYFYYWQPDALREFVADHGFNILSLTSDYTAHNNATWLYIVAQK